MISIKGLRAGWMVLNDLLGELSKIGVFIPDLTYADLRNTKMVIEYLSSYEEDIKEADPQDSHLQEETEMKLQGLRDVLMIWIEKEKGVNAREEWDKRFMDAIREEGPIETIERPTPISDIPREKDVGFFRIKLPDEIPVEIVSEIAEDCEVLVSLDGERHLQVSGKKECVRDAMKRLGQVFYGESKMK
ncbi:MAG: hypothetical protein BAJATHORv1_100016 [Candidatus Thorarchaeota archaeon]|nr:MAG: hypothetical protein BAJATHORv1_100016 [Candidatus Thorarchaeota archaeon]